MWIPTVNVHVAIVATSVRMDPALPVIVDPIAIGSLRNVRGLLPGKQKMEHSSTVKARLTPMLGL